MNFELEVAGHPCMVTVEPIGAVEQRRGSFRITVTPQAAGAATAPREYGVEARLTDLGLTLVYDGDRRVVDAAVTELNGAAFLVQLAGADVAVSAGQGVRRHVAASSAAAGTEERLVAPMPGRVLRVLARPGEEIGPRQPIVVIEAMKMENEISATRAGRVREVAVAEGESVAAGRTLAVIDIVR
jgi:biotin carboxyl carrier protein